VISIVNSTFTDNSARNAGGATARLRAARSGATKGPSRSRTQFLPTARGAATAPARWACRP
jgi:hypothetical protein